MFEIGQIVRCIDVDGVQRLLNGREAYRVRHVSPRGNLALEGVDAPKFFRADRFELVVPLAIIEPPPPVEIPAAAPVAAVFNVGDRVTIARPQLHNYAFGHAIGMDKYVGNRMVYSVRAVYDHHGMDAVSLVGDQDHVDDYNWDVRCLDKVAIQFPAEAVARPPLADKAPAPIAPGSLVRVIAAHAPSLLNVGDIVTVNRVHPASNLYSLFERPGRLYSAARFVAAPDAVAVPQKPAEQPLKTQGPFKAGDLVKIQQQSGVIDWDMAGQMEALREVGHAHKIVSVTDYGQIILENLSWLWAEDDFVIEVPLKPGEKAPDLRNFLAAKEKGKWHGSLCSFAKKTARGLKTASLNAPCYAEVKGDRLQEICIGTIPMVAQIEQEDEEHGLANFERYMTWLFTDSPWTPCFLPTTYKEAIETGGVLMNTDKPIGQIVGAAIAMRVGHECYSRMNTFIHLLDKGYSGTVAFLISLVFRIGADGEGWSESSAPGGHDCITDGLSYDAIIDWAANGFPDLGHKPCKEESGTYQIFKMIDKNWGTHAHIPPNQRFGAVVHSKVKVTIEGDGWNKKRIVNPQSVYDLADSLVVTLKEHKHV